MTNDRNKLAVVAGGSGDIGAASASALLEAGFTVASGDVKAAPARLADHPRFHSSSVDLTDRAAVDAWLGATTRELGPIQALVVSVGAVRSKRLIELTDDLWHQDLATLLDAPFIVATSAIRQMLKEGPERPRRIVFIGSWAAETPHPHIGAYSIAKAGLRALMRTLALDHGPDNILINEIAPGLVDAGLSREVFRTQPTLAEATRVRIPTRRLIHAEEIGHSVRYLCDESSVSTTGSVLTIDGGISLTSALDTSARTGNDPLDESDPS